MRSVIIGCLAGLSMSAAAFAQSAENVPVSLTCADGTALKAQFGESDVIVTLPDGQSVTLKGEPVGSGFSYRSPKFVLSGKGDALEWTVGKKAPVSCEVDDATADVFDEPLTVDETALEPDPQNPDVERKVFCYRYKDFAVKEVDWGEKGAQRLALMAPDAACEEKQHASERPLKDFEGYYLGATGDYVFFSWSDGFNGGMPFSVFKIADLSLVTEDSFAGDTFEQIEKTDSGLVVTYQRVYSAECSLYLDGGNCPDLVKKAIPGLGTIAPIPECGPAYKAEMERTPDYAKEVSEAPSVITYHARMMINNGKVSYETLAGDTSCRVPD